MKIDIVLAAALGLAFAAACSTPNEPVRELTAADPRFDTDYVLVILKTGPRIQEHSPEQRIEIQAGHMANINRLAEQRKLFIAGPFGEPRHDPTWRGIFVFDVRTVEEAQALASTDPGAVAGVFAMDTVPFHSASGLPRLLDLEREDEERAKQEGRELEMQDRIRGYAMVVAHDAAAAERALEPLFAQGRVVLAGRLGGEMAGGGMYVLDFDKLEEAKSAIGPELEQVGGCSLGVWYAARNLAKFAQQ